MTNSRPSPASRYRLLIALGVVLCLALVYFWMRTAIPPTAKPPTEAIAPAREVVAGAGEAAKPRAALPGPVTPSRPDESEPPDTLRAAVLQGDTENAMVIDVSRILTASVGEVVLDCLGLEANGPRRAELAQTGMDIMRDIDRIAFTDGALLFSGQFGSAARKLGLVPGVERIGNHGLLMDGGRFVMWRGELAIISEGDPNLGRRIVDRLEGRAERGTPVFSTAQAQGDIYASWDADSLVSEIMPKAPGAGDLVKYAQRVTFSANVDDGVVQTAKSSLMTPRRALLWLTSSRPSSRRRPTTAVRPPRSTKAGAKYCAALKSPPQPVVFRSRCHFL